jgi:hypothetical protein
MVKLPIIAKASKPVANTTITSRIPIDEKSGIIDARIRRHRRHNGGEIALTNTFMRRERGGIGTSLAPASEWFWI